MAYIKTLKNNELIGGTDNTDVYPVSTTQAIFSQKPDGTIPSGIKHQRLEDRLEDHESDAALLHRQTEKVVPYISGVLKEGTTTISSPVEINGRTHTWQLTAHAKIETPGDEPDTYIDPNNMTVKTLTVTSGGLGVTVPGEKNGNYWVGTYTIPSALGTYTARFDCTYGSIQKDVSITATTNLRKYFGFVPDEIISQGDNAVLQYLVSGAGNTSVSNFSNSVACTVTIPVNGTGNKYIYFAVPNSMTITQVIQTASQLQLDLQSPVTATRSIDGVVNTFTYKLYKTVRTPDSSEPKNVQIK